MPKYSDKLKDPKWQKKRLQVLDLANWACEDCGRRDTELQVHHCAYIPGCEPWDYDSALLMATCATCHHHRQGREDCIRVEMGKITRFMSPQELDGEAWNMVAEMSQRQTARLANAFLPEDQEAG